MSKLTIKVHENKSEAFDYSRASTPVAKTYELLDDYFCDDAGALRKDAVEKIFILFRNEKDLVDRCQSKATKSHSIAWEALLREIQATLEWDDEFPHATKLSSEQVKNWFKLKGRDFKEDLKPLVDAIDKQRKTWDEERASNKAESIYGRPDSKADELAGKYYVAIDNDSEGTIYTSKQEFDDYASAEEWANSELERNAGDEKVYLASIYKLYVDTYTQQLASDLEGTILKSDVCESKKCEGSKTPEDAVLYIFTSLKDNDILAGYIDMEVVKNNLADLVEEFEGRFDFDTDRGSFVATMLLDSNDERDDDTVADKWNRCADLTYTIMELFDIPNGEDSTNENWEAIQWELYDGGITDIYTKDESKKSESIVTDLTNAIQQNQPEVLLSDDAVTYFNDYDEMLDAFEGAYQTIIHIENKHGGEEMMFLYVPEDNIIVIGDFDVDRADTERAKELMEKFVHGELEQKPGNDEYLGGLDYIAIVDGNTYTSTVFVEKE